jgi:hypothetical protein
MKLKLAACVALLLSTLTFEQLAHARNDRILISIAQALEVGKAKSKINPDIPLFFGKSKHPAVAQKLSVLTTSRKTNSVGKSDSEACIWAFLSTIIVLQDDARKNGGNAIVELKSIYEQVTLDSETEFSCAAGGLMAGVKLEGTVVKLAKN